jgi:thiamine-monophosphate kinase
MAALPRWAMVSVGAPPQADPNDLRAIENAMAGALNAEGAAIVGGNLTATDGPAWISVTLIGEVERGAHWSRLGARAGDVLAVTGHPGRAAATLALAMCTQPPSFKHVPLGLAEAFANPACRVRAAAAMAKAGGVNGAIDLSDGLSGDLAHLCKASGVGAVVFERKLLEDAQLTLAARALAALRPDAGATPESLVEQFRFSPGDDYELLLSIEPGRFDACADAAREAGTPLVRIGQFTPQPGHLLLQRVGGEDMPLPGHGFDHFR